MWVLLRRIFGRDGSIRNFRAIVQAALALNERYEVRSDGLVLDELSARLNICWRARDVHPWDADDPPPRKEALFLRQLMDDAEGAIDRLFERLPEVDVIEVKVLDLNSDRLMASGIVTRTSLSGSTKSTPSVRMRLANLGIECHFPAELALNAPVHKQEEDLRLA
jgi:hypothetical protein